MCTCLCKFIVNCLKLWISLFVTFNPLRLIRLHDEKGKREIAESVAVNKARELEVQKRTSIMMTSISHSLSSDLLAHNAPSSPLMDTLEFASKVSPIVLTLSLPSIIGYRLVFLSFKIFPFYLK